MLGAACSRSAILRAICHANRRLGGMEHAIMLAARRSSKVAVETPPVRFVQRGAVASIDGGTLVLDESTISSADNTTVRTFCSL